MPRLYQKTASLPSAGLSPVLLFGLADAPNSATLPEDLPKDVQTHLIAAGGNGRPDLNQVFQHLGEMGKASVLVEAGGTFIASLLKQGLVDRLIWTRSSGVIGGDGLPSLANLGLGDLADGRIFRRVASQIIDEDAIEVFHRR